MRTSALALLFLMAWGCSASHRIAVETNRIGQHASEIERIATRIGSRSKDAETISDSVLIIEEASAIQAGVAGVHSALPGVTDRTPWWSDMLKWIAVAAAGLAVAWIISATGLGTAIRIAVGWIPRRSVTEAEMARATMATDKPETVREWVAMKRASDPAFNAAWQKASE